MSGCRGAVATACRSRAIPHDCTRDARVDEQHGPLWRSFEVEGLGEAVRVCRVVVDRDLLVGNASPEPAAEIAALLEQSERAERVVREVVEQVGYCVRLEDGAVDTRVE